MIFRLKNRWLLCIAILLSQTLFIQISFAGSPLPTMQAIPADTGLISYDGRSGTGHNTTYGSCPSGWPQPTYLNLNTDYSRGSSWGHDGCRYTSNSTKVLLWSEIPTKLGLVSTNNSCPPDWSKIANIISWGNAICRPVNTTMPFIWDNRYTPATLGLMSGDSRTDKYAHYCASGTSEIGRIGGPHDYGVRICRKYLVDFDPPDAPVLINNSLPNNLIVNLSWNSVPWADNYIVYKNNNIFYSNTTDLNIIDTINYDSNFSYQVISHNNISGDSVSSNIISIFISAPFNDSKLRINTSIGIQKLATPANQSSCTSPLIKVKTLTGLVCLKLVPTTDPNASKLRVRIDPTTWAVRKY